MNEEYARRVRPLKRPADRAARAANSAADAYPQRLMHNAPLRAAPLIAEGGTMKLMLALSLIATVLLMMPQAHAADAMAPTMPGVGLKGKPFPQTDGSALYEVICQSCHMPGGAGASGAGTYPALAHNTRLAAKAYPVVMV